VNSGDLAAKSRLWLRGYRHGNTETKSDVLLDMPLEYYEGVAQGARDYGPEYDYYHHH
jgi:hypothetical protein